MGLALQKADIVRLSAIQNTNKDDRASFSQYLTPPQTALLAVSLFSDCDKPSCLDLGAGTGILSVALHERFGDDITIDAIDIDGRMLDICHDELSSIGVKHSIIEGDAIESDRLKMYDRVILNPPYKKMASNDVRQEIIPVRSPNLYSAFIMIAVSHLKSRGECVAIIPRSWMNGQYFRPFREWLLSNASLDAMHVYGSRTEIFSDTNVLQETMIVKLSKKPQSSYIRVSESKEKGLDPFLFRYSFRELVDPVDKVVSIKPCDNIMRNSSTLKEAGFCASTGKVVDFRSGEYIRANKTPRSVRLVYSHNFSKGNFTHPVDAGKPQWYEPTNEKSSKQLVGPGHTVVVKRFSSKEEKRRVVAYYLEMKEPIALENHLNYIHRGTSRKTVLIDELTAKGLTVWLNSSFIDRWFRNVSGSTQVNASDLSKMPIPSNQHLSFFGQSWFEDMTVEDADALCKEALDDVRAN